LGSNVIAARNRPVEPMPEPEPDRGSADTLSFEEVYAAYVDHVARWVRLLGAPMSDREDLVQEVFVIVHRRLPHFRGDSLGGFIYRVTQRKVRDFRRLAWFRRVFRGEVASREAGEPARSWDALETKERSIVLDRLLDRLNDHERTALLLFELDGVSGQQIAELQSVSVNTVWARIYSARRKLRTGLTKFDRRASKGRGA
jgi:RNA polymerase sigma-70 factor (ECF subfamily)